MAIEIAWRYTIFHMLTVVVNEATRMLKAITGELRILMHIYCSTIVSFIVFNRLL